MTSTVTVHDVVAFLLSQARGHLGMAAIHRMTYYAQGWHLAWAGTPLFDEEIRVRKTGPVVHALFPVQTNGASETEWAAGKASAITGPSAEILKAVFNSYGHMTGLSMGENAHKEAPCILALARATEADRDPVVDLTEMKAFFKALDDAPEDTVAYANRFMSRYADDSLEGRP